MFWLNLLDKNLINLFSTKSVGVQIQNLPPFCLQGFWKLAKNAQLETGRFGYWRQHLLLSLLIAPLALMSGCGGGSDKPAITGGVSTFAVGLNSPFGITTSGGNLYVTNSGNHTVVKIAIASSGVVEKIAGTGSPGFANGTGTAASFKIPTGITTDGIDLYVTDTDNHAIRQIDIASAIVATSAGMGTPASNNGTATVAGFSAPFGVVWNATKRNLYVADSSNNTIRQVTVPTGEVSTIAGASAVGATDGFVGADARFNNPSGIATDGTYLYVADTANHTIRTIDISAASAVVSTLAGSAGIPGSADGTGINATFNSPLGMVVKGNNLFVADSVNNTIRQIDLVNRQVTTLAGNAISPPGFADGSGTIARFNNPSGITTDGISLYVTDTGNNSIRKIQ